VIKGKDYHTYTESYAREKEEWFDQIPEHVAAFLKGGGSIYQAAPGESAYTQQYSQHTHAFRINPQRESKLTKPAKRRRIKADDESN
jgi:hypothetical protein